MALVNASEMLKKAHEGHYAVGHFNINNLFYPALNNCLCALVAREKRDVNPAVCKVSAAAVQNCVKLGVADVKIFCIKAVVGTALPRENVVIAPRRKAVVADGKNAVFVIYDAGAHLRIRVLASFGAQKGCAHKKLVPRNIVVTLRHFLHLLSLLFRYILSSTPLYFNNHSEKTPHFLDFFTI